MKEKKETSNVTVYLCMILLLVPVILPPVFRTLMPKETVAQESNMNKIEILTCQKTSEDNLYQINSNTRYIDGKIKTVTLTYSKMIEENQETTTETSPDQTTPTVPESPQQNGETPLSEETVINEEKNDIADPDILMFRELLDVSISEDSNKFSVEMNQQTLKSNTAVENLANYFSDLASQQAYYEGLNYTCTKIES